MSAFAAPATTADVRCATESVTRYLYGHFRRSLTLDELGDAAAEAVADAERAAATGTHIEDLNRWLRRAAWRNALDTIRRHKGEGAVPRERPLTIDGLTLAGDDEDQHELLNEAARASDAEALQRAFSRLTVDEQRALTLRYFDQLPVAEVLEILGCTRSRYEHLTKKAIRTLREALIADTRDKACRTCRSLVVLAMMEPLGIEAATQRDTHLEHCLTCRAFSARQRGLIALLPLPALTVVDRFVARFHGLIASGPQHGEAIAGSVAAGGAGTAGMFGAGAAKTLAIVCTAGAVTAGVCTTAITPNLHDRPSKPRAQQHNPKPKKKRPTKPKPTRAVVTAAVAATHPTKQQAEPKKPGPQPRKPDKPKPTKAQKEREAAEEASPFLPESAAPAEPIATPTATAANTTPAPTQPTNKAPAPKPEPQSTSSDFSQEFTP